MVAQRHQLPSVETHLRLLLPDKLMVGRVPTVALEMVAHNSAIEARTGPLVYEEALSAAKVPEDMVTATCPFSASPSWPVCHSR